MITATLALEMVFIEKDSFNGIGLLCWFGDSLNSKLRSSVGISNPDSSHIQAFQDCIQSIFNFSISPHGNAGLVRFDPFGIGFH
jgi:hypothetical protein